MGEAEQEKYFMKEHVGLPEQMLSNNLVNSRKWIILGCNYQVQDSTASLKTVSGISKFRHLRGRVFSRSYTQATRASVASEKSLSLGKYWRNKPLGSHGSHAPKMRKDARNRYRLPRPRQPVHVPQTSCRCKERSRNVMHTSGFRS